MTEARRKMREQKKAAEVERLRGVLEEKTGTSRSAKGQKAFAQKRLDELTGVTAEREKAGRISELEKKLENRGPRSSRNRQRFKDELAELKGESPDQVNSFTQAVEDAVAEAATPPPQRDRSGSGELIRRGQMEAAEREKPLIIDDYADEPLIIDDYADEKGYEESLKDADVEFEEAFGESIGDYESRQGVEQEAAEKADASFKEPTLRAEPVPEMDEKESGRLFKMIMGSSFNVKSSMDKGKMEVLKKAKAENPDLSDNQLALKIYRDYM
jgi:hypothetical protein